MVRIVGFLAGLVFVVALLVAAVMPREEVVPDITKKYYTKPVDVRWQQDGPLGFGVLGTFDRQQLQRGFQVYKDVCSACHGLNRVAFRNLQEIGFSEPEVKALAKNWLVEVPTIDPATGEPSTRKALPSDRIPSPYPNETAARAANNNAYPLDLSLITKARANGPDYVHSLLVGYGKEPPQDFEVPEGLHYNPYFHSLAIAMPQPLADEQLEFADGTKATVDQMSMDVTAFLQWASEPKQETRKRTGLAVMIFLSILTVLSYLTYRKVWADQKH
jgi:ubiquinol-cytochrome c reductase cytochrome c1 subunit